jgi:hypothetical protein
MEAKGAGGKRAIDELCEVVYPEDHHGNPVQFTAMVKVTRLAYDLRLCVACLVLFCFVRLLLVYAHWFSRLGACVLVLARWPRSLRLRFGVPQCR